MRYLVSFLVIALTLSMASSVTPLFASEQDEGSDGSGKVLTGALMGGLLGGGLGAAIGSGSGRAGKGALIGAGVGAVGGGLVGASQKSKESTVAYTEPEASSKETVRKRVVKEYDENGNLISEKEVRK